MPGFDNYNRYNDFGSESSGVSSEEAWDHSEDKTKRLREDLSRMREIYYQVVMEAEIAKKDLETQKILVEMKDATIDELSKKIDGMQNFTRFDAMILD